MTASMFQDEGGFTEVVGQKIQGQLPQQVPAAKSELQIALDAERNQHEQKYIYENGHNDHGWGP